MHCRRGYARDVWESGKLGNRAVDLMDGGDTLVFNEHGQTNTNGVLYMLPASDIGARTDTLRAIKVIRVLGKVQVLKYREEFSPPWRAPANR